MRVQAYLNAIKATVDQYARLAVTINATVDFEVRSGDQAYLRGEIHFADGSVLHFKEFIDATDQTIDKLAYSYHYQDARDQMVFRYDNAAHKPPLPSLEHKHLPQRIIVASAPSLADVLAEVVMSRGWDR